MVMTHFRPAAMGLTEEERENLRREKLRCEFGLVMSKVRLSKTWVSTLG